MANDIDSVRSMRTALALLALVLLSAGTAEAVRRPGIFAGGVATFRVRFRYGKFKGHFRCKPETCTGGVVRGRIRGECQLDGTLEGGASGRARDGEWSTGCGFAHGGRCVLPAGMTAFPRRWPGPVFVGGDAVCGLPFVPGAFPSHVLFEVP